MPRFCANLSMMFPELEMPRRFAAAREAGFKAVEVLRPYEYPVADVRGWLQDAGLEFVLLNSPPGKREGDRGLAGQPGREAEFRDALGKSLEYCVGLGAKMVHMMAGSVPEGTAREACEETFVENMYDAGIAARGMGIKLTLEPLNSRDAPNYLHNTAAKTRELISRIALDNVLLQYDLYHLQIMQGDLVENLRKNLDVVGHIQFSSLPGRNEPQYGEVNLPYVFDQIDALGYKGWVGCEYRPRGDTIEGLKGWGASYGLG